MTCYGDLIIAPALSVTITATGPASAPATETATAAGGAFFAWTCKVYGERTAAEVFPMEHGNGVLSFLV
jgi:hypothetical protein